jgi:DNA-binding NarL/FixJ family response regulator
MRSNAVQVPATGERDVILELAQMRGRLDAALLEGANELNRMRQNCRTLAGTMSIIGTEDGGFHGRAKARALVAGLTAREVAVLKAIAEGDSTKQIAFRLKMTFKTAVSHRTRLMTKLGIHETATLVRLAVAAGIVSVQPRFPVSDS